MKSHELLHIGEDLEAIGDMRNVGTLTVDRNGKRVKEQLSNNHDATYWKSQHYLEQCWMQPVDILQVFSHAELN
jgi:hypothetical protein